MSQYTYNTYNIQHTHRTIRFSMLSKQPQGNSCKQQEKKKERESIENWIRRHTFAPLFNLIKYWVYGAKQMLKISRCIRETHTHTLPVYGWNDNKWTTGDQWKKKTFSYTGKKILHVLLLSCKFPFYWIMHQYSRTHISHTFFNLPFVHKKKFETHKKNGWKIEKVKYKYILSKTMAFL